MTVKVGNNIMALQAQRQLDNVSSRQSRAFERLSSGMRINSASDDAAGLAIADALRADSRVLSTAVRNANDGISALSIADSALNELTRITVRIAELAEQSANGVYSQEQRQSLDREAQALAQEFQRITDATSFNNLHLLDGSVAQLDLQVGLNGDANSRIYADLESAASRIAGDGTFQASFNVASNSGFYGALPAYNITFADVNNDGNLDLAMADESGDLNIALNDGSGNFGQYSHTTFGDHIDYFTFGDYNSDGNVDVVAGRYDGGANSMDIAYGTGSGSFGPITSLSTSDDTWGVGSGDFDGDGNLDIVGMNHNSTSLVFQFGNGAGGFTTSEIGITGSNQEIAVGDFNGDGLDDVFWGSFGGNIHSVLGDSGRTMVENVENLGPTGDTWSVGDIDGDGFDDVVVGGGGVSTDVFFSDGDGTFSGIVAVDSTSGNSEAVGDINGDGLADIVVHGGSQVQTYISNGDRTFSAGETFAASGNEDDAALVDVDNDGALDIVTSNGTDNNFSVFIGNFQAIGGLAEFSLLSRQDALSTLDAMNETRDRLAQGRGKLGSALSRLEVAIRNNLVAGENLSAAEARIRDVDIATTSAELVRTNILKQTAASILAQASQQPALALELLRG